MMAGLHSLDHDVVEGFMSEWEQLFDRGEYRRMGAFYTEDARLIATQMDTLVGRPAIESFWRTSCEGARATGLRRKVQLEGVESSWDLGYVRGTVALTLPEVPAGVRVRYLTVWRRERDGVWRLAVDISSPAPHAVDLASRMV